MEYRFAWDKPYTFRTFDAGGLFRRWKWISREGNLNEIVETKSSPGLNPVFALVLDLVTEVKKLREEVETLKGQQNGK